MPMRAMQKLNTRYGCMFWCGWLPPTLEIVAGNKVVRLAEPV
jgi:hypothetical protein